MCELRSQELQNLDEVVVLLTELHACRVSSRAGFSLFSYFAYPQKNRVALSPRGGGRNESVDSRLDSCESSCDAESTEETFTSRASDVSLGSPRDSAAMDLVAEVSGRCEGATRRLVAAIEVHTHTHTPAC